MPAPTVVHTPRPDLGARIRRHREAGNMTRTELGAAIGRASQSVAAWEHGQRSPSLSALYAVAEVLGVSVAELLDQDEPAP